MYNKIFKVDKNNMNLDLMYLRNLLEDPNVKQNEIIKACISTNLNILKNHKSIILNIDVACLGFSDIKHVNFSKK